MTSPRGLPDASRSDRHCGWCRGGIRATARGDSLYCSTRCRQAAHRTRVRRLELEATDRPLRLAYADPPYPGNARLYRGHPDFAGEVDHRALLSRLATYDGWALSTSAAALPDVLALAVAQDLRVRVAVWARTPAPHPTARILNAWEAVIYSPARAVARDVGEPIVHDLLLDVVARRRSTLPSSVVGMKPPAFAAWVFRLLGARRGDSLADLFPGSGLVARTWLWSLGLDPSRASTNYASGSGSPDASRLAAVAGDA